MIPSFLDISEIVLGLFESFRSTFEAYTRQFNTEPATDNPVSSPLSVAFTPEIQSDLCPQNTLSSPKMKVRLHSHRIFSTDPESQLSPIGVRQKGRRNSLELQPLCSDETQSPPLIMGHQFHSIPLEADTFCDFCSCPIYSLGSQPSCQRCTDCHITCHQRCIRNVRVSCIRSADEGGSVSPALPVTKQDTSANCAEPLDQHKLLAAISRLNIDQHEDDLNAKGAQSGGADLWPVRKAQSYEGIGVLPSPKASIEEKVADNSLYPDHTIYYTAASDHRELSSHSLPFYKSTPQTVDGKSESNSPNHLVTHKLRHSRLRQIRLTGPAAIKSRHSFLATTDAGYPLSTRLTYGFSSLDREAIKSHGIEVREIDLTEAKPTFDFAPIEENSAADSESSTIRTATSDSSVFSQSITTSSEFGFASTMQSTVACVREKPRRGKLTGYSPSPSPIMYPVVVGPRSRLPYTVDELQARLSVFNTNEFGLQSRMSSSLPPGDCEGQIRIHINLLRPIRMVLTVRPISIFDLVGQETETDDDHHFPERIDSPVPFHFPNQSQSKVVNGVHRTHPKSSVIADTPAFSADSESHVKGVRKRFSKRLFGSHPQSSTFWLPRGSTKLIHVKLSTTVQSVITLLLDRFQIVDNPQKFALYEHTIEGEHKVSVRKLFDDECPLGLVLRWTEGGSEQFNKLLAVKRLVLQENETGDIEWTGFSLPELNTFLSILNHEEADYRRRIELKYEIRRKEILKLMASKQLQDVDAAPSDSTATSQDIHNGDFDDVATIEGPSDQGNVTPTVVTSSHSPERTPKPSTSTLPGFFFGKRKSGATLFKPSAYKQMKKAEKAREKVALKLEKERLKAEAKRLKSEAMYAHPESQHHHHVRRLFVLTGRSLFFTHTEATEARPDVKL